MESGHYEPLQSVTTISNAMDVGDPSNFIRIRTIFKDNFKQIQKNLSSYSFSDYQTREAMKDVYKDSGYIMDPHGAVGYLGLKQYSWKELNEYVLGSAEVVGLMCLRVFCNGIDEKYQTLKPFAMKLGAAYQKINFLRDLKSDFIDMERSYFPNIDLRNFTEQDKTRIEEEIESDFIYLN